MNSLHIYPAQAQGNTAIIRDTWVKHFQDQYDRCVNAHALVANPSDDWIGGHGATGRLPQASHEFLAFVAGQINDLATSQNSFLGAINQYLDALDSFAGAIRSADNAAAEEFDMILRDLDAKGR